MRVGSRQRLWRRFAFTAPLWAALLALALAPLVSGRHATHNAPTGAAALQAALGPGAKIILCAHVEDGQTPAGGGAAHDHCVACQAGPGFALLLLLPALAAVRPPRPAVLAPPAFRLAAALRPRLPGRARAPPATI